MHVGDDATKVIIYPIHTNYIEGPRIPSVWFIHFRGGMHQGVTTTVSSHIIVVQATCGCKQPAIPFDCLKSKSRDTLEKLETPYILLIVDTMVRGMDNMEVDRMCWDFVRSIDGACEFHV